MRRMASWQEIEQAAPELVARARGYLDAHVHNTLATNRRDGAPRISGTEIFFAEGDVWLGSMPGALKARDLQRDPRFALHSGSKDPGAGWDGDAKFAGVVEEITDRDRKVHVFGLRAPSSDAEPEDFDFGDSHLFRCDIRELSVAGLNAQRTGMVIDVWTPERGAWQIERTG
jgi:hypothetical protein